MHQLNMLTIFNTMYTTGSDFGCRTHNQMALDLLHIKYGDNLFPPLGKGEREFVAFEPNHCLSWRLLFLGQAFKKVGNISGIFHMVYLHP